MKCATCKKDLITPKVAPHGGFLCSNKHYQCDSCHQQRGKCGVCKSDTSFVKVNMPGAVLVSKASETFSRLRSSLSINDSMDSFSSKEEGASGFASFTRSLLEKLDSEEQPNVQDSESCVASRCIEKQRTQNQVKTLFVGRYQPPDSEIESCCHSEPDEPSANETYTVSSVYTATPRDLDTEDEDVPVTDFPTVSKGCSSGDSKAREDCTPYKGQGIVPSLSISSMSSCSSLGSMSEYLEKYEHLDYLVMQSCVAAEPPKNIKVPVTENMKKGNSAVDQKMKRVLATLQESPQCERNEKPLSEIPKPFVKKFTPEALVVTIPTVNEGACGQSDDVSELISEKKLSNTFRAVYKPCCSRSVDPPPQFEQVAPKPIHHDFMLGASRNVLSKPTAAYHLNILRAPITCPEESCARLVFVSDFNKHMVIDHPYLPKKSISPRECNNFLLNPSVPSNAANKCNIVYLVRDKITDLGSSQYKDLLPVFLMSARMSLADICGVDTQSDEGFLMIWLVGIVPEGMALRASMTVYANKGKVPTFHMSNSGQIHSVRDSQDPRDIFRTGKMMLLSDMNLKVLTADGRGLVQMQVVVN